MCQETTSTPSHHHNKRSIVMRGEICSFMYFSRNQDCHVTDWAAVCHQWMDFTDGMPELRLCLTFCFASVCHWIIAPKSSCVLFLISGFSSFAILSFVFFVSFAYMSSNLFMVCFVCVASSFPQHAGPLCINQHSCSVNYHSNSGGISRVCPFVWESSVYWICVQLFKSAIQKRTITCSLQKSHICIYLQFYQ